MTQENKWEIPTREIVNAMYDTLAAREVRPDPEDYTNLSSKKDGTRLNCRRVRGGAALTL